MERKNQVIWKKPALVSGLTIGAVVVAALAAQQIVWEREVTGAADAAQESLERAAQIFESRLRNRANDFFILRTVAEAEQNLVQGPTSVRFSQAAAAMMFGRAAYLSVRVATPAGREIFGIDWRQQGLSLSTGVALVPPENLKDISSSEIFSEANSAPGGSAVVSRLTWNPSLPGYTLTIAGPMAAGDGSPMGVLLLDLEGAGLLRDLKDDRSEPYERVQVLDAEGNWLVSAYPQALRQQPGPGDSLKDTQPGLWKELSASVSGHFREDGKLYVYRRIDPVSPVKAYVPLRLPVQGGERVCWNLVNVIPDAVIRENMSTARFGIWLVCGIALFVLVPSAWSATIFGERRRMEAEELRASEERFRLLVENVQDYAIFLLDAEGCVATWNQGAERLKGYSTDEILGKWFGIFYPEENAEKPAKLLEIARREGRAEDEGWRRRKDGRLYWANTVITALRNSDGKLLGFAKISRDVTERREAEEKLRDANANLQFALATERDLVERAHAAEKAKGEFLAMMSHEIRTPMNGVLGFAELLEDTPLRADQQEYVQTITTSGEALVRIIDDILDFSRIESGRLEIENREFSPRDLVEGVCDLLNQTAARKGLLLDFEIEADVPSRVSGDSGRLRQVLVNLTGNAIKFTERGSVKLSLKRASDSKLRFAVRDTGPGLAPDKIEQVFKPFTQADSSISRRYGGTGLGLAISQRLVDLMGGKLTVQSRAGEGCEFSFALPIGHVLGEDDPSKEPGDELDGTMAESYPLRIVVADDDPVNLRLSRLMLNNFGYAPMLARTGSEVLRLFNEEHPDCILMDMRMPEMDGLETTRRIRTSPGGDHVFIAALTANVLPSEQEQCLAAGMNAHLGKPIKRGRLAELLIQASRLQRLPAIKNDL